ncbi:inosine monophosphate dehydrogenase [Corynespora cassiicola Philippines]|uniref:Inosine monophosphate dehydrogenase n=1 Tax=Corynespora cassiicola Philippines TaxID=1448308 RepID=A0A2T2N565_CORCC|nr:inosine monophosphate dehydrogenase [Corynespora cassiicola Philippines]
MAQLQLQQHIARLKEDYPWISTPLVIGAPMRLIALAELAVEISKAGGIGFIGAGTDVSDLDKHLTHATSLLSYSPSPSPLPSRANTLPLGIGFINWGAQLAPALDAIRTHRPAAVWFFAASSPASLAEWAARSREACAQTRVWVQVGSVAEARGVLRAGVRPDVLVVQGTDAGGHGLVRGAGVVSLVPEVCDAVAEEVASGTTTGGKDGYEGPVIVAAGGIAEKRGAAAAFCLGACGVVLGTRFLAAREANIAKGYQEEVLRAGDGGQTTIRTKVYDELRETVWADTHNARGVINKSFEDAVGGLDVEENKRLYAEEVNKGDAGWGVEGRMTTYAGAAVGLVKEVKGAGEIVEEVREGVKEILGGLKDVKSVL